MNSDGDVIFVAFVTAAIVVFLTLMITLGVFQSGWVKVSQWEEKSVEWQDKDIRIPQYVVSKGVRYKCELDVEKE